MLHQHAQGLKMQQERLLKRKARMLEIEVEAGEKLEKAPSSLQLTVKQAEKAADVRTHCV